MIDLNNLDFDKVKEALVEHFSKGNPAFTDFDAAGSNMSVLLDLMAYVTQQNGYYLSRSINESFFDSATLRNSVVKHAKTIGYTPRSILAPYVEIKFKVTNDDNIIAPNTIISGVIGSATFPFVNLGPIEIKEREGVGIFHQGKLINTTVDYKNKIISLPSPRIDRNTIKIKVNGDDWYKASRLSDGDVYYIQEGKNNATEIYFGYTDGTNSAGYGNTPKFDTKIDISYLETQGINANGCSKYKTTNTNYKILSNNISQGGDVPEGLDEIKFVAPKVRATQHRAITKQDYFALISEKFGDIEDLSIWGGEENDPPEYGTVYCCVKPKSANYITKNIKDEISKYISKFSTVGISTKIVDPKYLYCTFNVHLKMPYWTEHSADNRANAIDYTKKTIDNYMSNKLGFDKDILISNNRATPETEPKSKDKDSIQPIIDTEHNIVLVHNGSVSNKIYNEIT
jgi:hypothetical protein